MKPKREDGLHYFIISESDQISYNGTMDVWGKKQVIDSIIKDGSYTSAEIKIKHHHYLEEEGGKMLSKIESRQSFRIPVDFVSIEEVYDLHRYAGSIDFTIGSSKRKEEEKKFLVAFKFDKHITSRYNFKQHHFEYMVFVGIMSNNHGIVEGTITFNADLLYGKSDYGFSTGKLGYFSYDKHFKYYTLLCD